LAAEGSMMRSSERASDDRASPNIPTGVREMGRNIIAICIFQFENR
jgi:hypothetical protein